MEQPILSVDEERWVNAIVKLTSLTYAGKLLWQRHVDGTEGVYNSGSYPYGSSIDEMTSKKYLTKFEGSVFVLRLSWPLLPSLHPLFPKSASSGLVNSGAGFVGRASLSVFEPGGAKLFDFPRLSVLDSLTEAVLVQVEGKKNVESVLSAIEGAT